MTPDMGATHKPSRKQSIIFFFFSLAVAAFVFVFVFILNKGTLVVEGRVPFVVHAGNESVTCEASPCRLKVTPRKYAVSVQKDGFFDESAEVEVKRFAESKIGFEFKIIPKLNMVGKVVLPAPFAPLRPPFLGTTSLKNFPKKITSAVFSASGTKAIFSIGKSFFVYDTKDFSVSNLDVATQHDPAWAGERILFLEDSADFGQTLKILESGKTKAVVSFERPFKSPTLSGSSSGKYALITENISSRDVAYYLVDIDNKTRKKLTGKNAATAAKWAGDYIVFGEIVDDRTKVYVLDVANSKEIVLPSMDSKNVISPKTETLVFVSAVRSNTGSSEMGLSITEALLSQAKQETLEPGSSGKSQFVIEYNLVSDTSRTLIEIPGREVGQMTGSGTSTVLTKKIEKETINSLCADPSGKKLYFAGSFDEQIDGIKLFEVILAE